MGITTALPLPTDLLTNLTPVNKEGDFGTPVNGVITLTAGTHYLLNKTITMSSRLVIPTGGSITISSSNLGAHFLIYTGSGTFLSGDAISIFHLTTIIVVGNSSAKFLDFNNGGIVIITQVISDTWNHAGELSCTFLCNNAEIDNISGTGLEFTTRTSITNANIILTTFFIGNVITNPSTILYDFKNANISKIEINGGGAITGGNETLFNFDKDIIPDVTTISLKNFDAFDPITAIYGSNSSDQSRINTLIKNNFDIANSTSIVKLSLINNTAVTTISSQSANTAINSNALYAIDSLIERFVLQDVCTFDNAGNTVDTTFNHGLVNTDRVFLNAYSGSTLPTELNETTEYYVVNKNAQDFQLSLTSGGAAVTFTGDGSGTLHYRHNTGVTQLAHVIYIGNETIKCRADGWETIESTTGTKIDVRATVMNIDTAGVITEGQVGSPIAVTSSESGVSNISNVATLSTGQGNVIYHRNDSGTTNIVGKDLLVNYNQVS